MTLQQAINVLDEYDFQGIDPEALQAISVIVLFAKTKVRALETEDIGNRVVETTTD